MFLQGRDYQVKNLVGGRKQNREAIQGKVRSMSKATGEVTSLRNKVNEKDITAKEVKERTSYREGLGVEFVSLKEDLENSNKKNEELLQAFEEHENEILKLIQQVEEGRKIEEIVKKQYLEREEKYQVEENILKGKIEEKDKLLRFQDSTKIFYNILSSQRYLIIKYGIGFHKTVKGKLSSQTEARNSNAIEYKF